MFRIAALAAAAGLATGCAGAAPPIASADPAWPAELPPRAYFEQVWLADPANGAVQPLADYLGHVQSFYAGSLLAPGWKRASRDFLRDAGPADLAALEPKLACLGQIAAGEWAKDNAGSRVPSASLLAWARDLKRARADGRLHEEVDRLLRDVGRTVSTPRAPVAKVSSEDAK
jgi:hypothetical protein